MRDARNCLSWWYPRIVGHVPTPETRRRTESDTWDLAHLLDGKIPGTLGPLCEWIAKCGTGFGYPMFLRTGQGSGKHEWNRTCCVRERAAIPSHVSALVEWSHTVDMMGLPHDVWVCRKMLAVAPLFRCAAYGGMPVVREWRIFARDGSVVCSHPYWPEGALEEGEPDNQNWRVRLAHLHAPAPRVALDYAATCSQLCGGAWSVDVLDAVDGLYVTDMATAEESFHWPDCERKAELVAGEAR